MPFHVGAGSSAIQIQAPLGQDPSSGASAGDLYYNTTDNAYKFYAVSYTHQTLPTNREV